MNDREKLIDILESAESAVYWNSDDCGFIEKIADHLIANGVTVQQWVPVRERFPSENEYCIVHYVHTYCDNDGYWEIGTSFFNGNQFQIWPAYKVTHWMPLPMPPKVDSVLVARCCDCNNRNNDEKCPLCHVEYKTMFDYKTDDNCFCHKFERRTNDE